MSASGSTSPATISTITSARSLAPARSTTFSSTTCEPGDRLAVTTVMPPASGDTVGPESSPSIDELHQTAARSSRPSLSATVPRNSRAPDS